MIEDKLTRLERVRLEALAQALRFPVEGGGIDEIFSQILRHAEQIERWLLAADGGGN